MKKDNKCRSVFGIDSPILFAICSISLVILGVFTFGDYGDDSWFCRTDWFWLRVVWFEFIFTIFWVAVFGSPLTHLLRSRKMTGATYATIATICLRAALISFVIWCVSAFIPLDTHWAKLPVLIQVVVALYYVVVVHMLPKVQVLQNDGMDQFLGSVAEPRKLVNLLRGFEKRCLESRIDVMPIKRLREKIQFSIPIVGKVACCDEYVELEKHVLKIVEEGVNYDHQLVATAEENVATIIEKCKI